MLAKGPLVQRGLPAKRGPKRNPTQWLCLGEEERRSEGAIPRYAVRDDEGDCNLYVQFCLRGGGRTVDYNPSVTSLRTGATSPYTGEAFPCAGTGTAAIYGGPTAFTENSA